MITIFNAFFIGCCYGQTFDNQAMELFHTGDSNGDGVLTLTEVLDEFDQLDLNGDGLESRHEFTIFLCEHAPDLYNMAHYLYDEFDIDGDHHLSNADYTAAFAMMDTNHDGQVTEAEYNAYAVAIFLKYGFAGTHQHNTGQCHAHHAGR